MRRGWFALVLIGLIAVFVAGCGGGGSSSSSETTSGGGESETAATGGAVEGALLQIIDAAPSPAVQGLDKGYEAKAEELGMEVSVAQSNFDPTKDIANIKDAISKGAKGLVLIPVSVPGDTAALNEAASKGICVGIAYSNISEENPIGPDIKTYYGYDDHEGARNLTIQMAKKMGGKGGLVYIGGAAADPGNQVREETVKKTLEEEFPEIEFLGSQPADYESAKARTVMQDFEQTYGDKITGVIAAADNMAEAAAQYIATSELAGKVTIGGFGGQATFVKMIEEGKAFATVPFPVIEDGERAVERVAECIEGKTTTVYDSSTTQPSLQPLKPDDYVLTAANVGEYVPEY